MRRFAGWFAAVAVVGLLVGTAATKADDEKIAIDKLPDAIKKAVLDRFPKAELKSAEKETEDGKTVYDVAIKYKDTNYEVVVSADGLVTGFEKEIAVKDTPQAVAKAIEEKYPKSTIKMVEEVYKIKGKDEKMEYYEIALETSDKKKASADVAPDGKILKTAVQKEKKD
jgi:uncharacterized membrane protein YkoI